MEAECMQSFSRIFR